LEDFADEVNLMQVFHKVIKAMLIYGNAYMEVVRDGKEIVKLKIIDPTWIDVYIKNNGEVIGYSQIIEDCHEVLWGTTGNPNIDQKFKKRVKDLKNIVHIKYNTIGAEKYGRSIISPLMPNLQTKLDMESNLSKVVFKYVAPLIWAKVGNDSFPANESVVTDISSTLRDLQAESEITTSHLVELSVLDFNAKGMDIKTPIDHTEQQIITGGQVPPVLLGISEGTDKAQAEVQLRSFGRHIKAIQRELKIEFEDKVIVDQDLGTEKDKLVWERAEEREWETDVDILRGLVTDGILTPQKANDLLPPRFQEELPEFSAPLNQNSTGPDGIQKPRSNQMKTSKVTDNPNDPTKTTKNPSTKGKRVNKTDREVPVK
jgi:hypothetical protein